MKKFCALLLGLAFVASLWAQEGPQTDLPRVKLQSGMYLLDVQVAQTPEQRAIGLMNRQSMPEHEGMLFVFERSDTQCFWMKNTLLPLSAAFIDNNGNIVNIEDMKPQSLDAHCSARPVKFVLEMQQGWFKKRGLKGGSHLKGIVDR
jgi:uncharacterized membrane protein (UPF0127 family)